MSLPVSITVSRNWADVRASLSIAHEAFVDSGFQSPLPSGVRLLPPHLNPGTFVALGMLDGRPAATIVVTADGPFGLPSDRSFVEEIDELRTQHSIVELGSFGVSEWARGASMPLLAHLFASLIRVLWRRPDSLYVIASLDASASKFYGRTFGFSPLAQGQRPLYKAPARLLGGARRQILATLEEPGGLRSEIRQLADGPPPPWLTVNDDTPEWPLADLALLLAESGELERMNGQSELAAPILAAYEALEIEEGVPLSRRRRWLGVAHDPDEDRISPPGEAPLASDLGNSPPAKDQTSA